MVEVTAVIPTLGRDIPRLNRAIKSIRKYSSLEQVRIVVVNNSGADSIPGMLEVDEHIPAGINLGYVGALELVRRRCETKYFWSVQDDMTLSNDVLSHLLKRFETNPKLGVVSPVLVRSGVIPARTRAGVFTNKAKTDWHNIPLDDVEPNKYVVPKELSFVSGSGALFSMKALNKVEGFNVSLFPLMHVDVEVCSRLRFQGWELALEPAAHISHVVNGSTPSLLAHLLDRINRPIVENYLKTGRQVIHEKTLIDQDLVEAVAHKASQLVIEIAKEGNARIESMQLQLRKLQDEYNVLAYEREQILSSRAWRITKPLRVANTLIKRVLHRETS